MQRFTVVVLLALLPGLGFWAGRAEAQDQEPGVFRVGDLYECTTTRLRDMGPEQLHMVCVRLDRGTGDHWYACRLARRETHIFGDCTDERGRWETITPRW